MNFLGATIVAKKLDKDSGVPVMLVLGDLDRWRSRGRSPPIIPGFHFADFTDLDAAILLQLCPEIILSGLVQQSFDVLDVAATLRTLDFRGRYRAVTHPIPNPGLIVAEVRSIAPTLNFAILSLNPG